MYLNASRTASIAMWKQSAGVAGATTIAGHSPFLPQTAWNRSACSVLVGNPVDGPPRCTLTITSGNSVMTELPLVIVNVQRGGPSTGLPTKTEQADLFQAVWGRNGECPAIVVAPATPADCFHMAIEAVRLAFKYMSPVFYLSDGYLANGAEPWAIPELDQLPEIEVKFASDPATFMPYARDPETLARPYALPGTPGLEHRVGGIEKQHITGNVNRSEEHT